MDRHLLRFDKTSTFAFVDLETYNLCLNFIANKPWQVGLMLVKGEDSFETHDILVKWPNPPIFNPIMVTQIFQCSVPTLLNRIDSEGKTPDEVFEKLYPILDKADYIVGHNILGFDLYLIKEWCKIKGKPWRHWLKKAIDTNSLIKGVKLNIPLKPTDDRIEYQYKMYHRIQKGLKSRLGMVGKEFGIEHDYLKLHDAIVDLDLNRKVWNRLKYQVEI
jgi:DNA polymerase III epsilon subunit-like protein